MANIKSQIKRDRTNEKSRLKNNAEESETRTLIKKVEKAVAENNKEEALKALPIAIKKIDEDVSLGILKKNTDSLNACLGGCVGSDCIGCPHS